jgi:hypothetical protein
MSRGLWKNMLEKICWTNMHASKPMEGSSADRISIPRLPPNSFFLLLLLLPLLVVPVSQGTCHGGQLPCVPRVSV